jgi:type IV secretory pathway TrbF-like protein
MEGSVYLKARQEWDERYADLVLGKRNWQITAASQCLHLTYCLRKRDLLLGPSTKTAELRVANDVETTSHLCLTKQRPCVS